MGRIGWLLAGMTLLFAAPLLAGGKSLTERPWRLQPYSGEIEAAWKDYNFDDSGWIEQRQPAQWQMLPQFEETYGGDMAYRYRFDFTRQAGRSYYLRFSGVFYSCRVWLNGKELGGHTGYFAPFEFDVTDTVKDKNVLLVAVSCPYEDADQRTMVLGVFGHWDVINVHRDMGGIYREVELVGSGDAHLRDFWLGTLALEENPAGSRDARVRLSGELVSPRPDAGPYTMELDLAPDNCGGEAYHEEWTQAAGEVTREFKLARPALWETWDRGEACQYRARVEVRSGRGIEDTAEFSTGIRTVAKRCQPGERREGHCWQMELNGRPLYIRGNNYAPSDAYLARATPELIAGDVKMMRESYYNMIRVHAHVDLPALYDDCDRAGILIWQDFPLQGGYAPEILEDAKKQARELPAVLGSHPSVALWSCQNEPSGKEVKWNLKVLDPALKRELETADPTRPVNLASGVPVKTDAHVYFGWDMGKPDDFGRYLYMPLFKPWMSFVTEFGSQSFPPYEDAVKFMAPELDAVDWAEVKEYHEFQDWRLDRRVPRTPGRDLREYIAATQAYQARVQQYYIDWLRSAKYDVNWGVVTFLLNDSNPAVTWSVVDYERHPKPAYFTIQQSFQPVYALARWRFAPYRPGLPVTLPIYVVNDLLMSYEGELAMEVVHNGEAVVSRRLPVSLLPDMPARRVDTIKFIPRDEGDYELRLTLTAPGLEAPVKNLTVLQVGKDASSRRLTRP